MSAVVTMTRKEQLLEAFRTAGRRGLTGAEMERVVGVCWRLRLADLRADGCVFLEDPSTVRRGTTFRWALVSERAPVGEDDAAALFDVAELGLPTPTFPDALGKKACGARAANADVPRRAREEGVMLALDEAFAAAERAGSDLSFRRTATGQIAARIGEHASGIAATPARALLALVGVLRADADTGSADA